MSRLMWLGLLGSLFLAGSASASYIGIFLDPGATSCAANVGPNPRIDLHVVAVLEGEVLEMTGAQFKIVGIPATWTPQNVLWVPDEGTALSLGNPAFLTTIHPQTPGVNVAFHTCQAAPEVTRVPLGRLILLGPPTEDNVHLRVAGFDLVENDHPSPMIFDCSATFDQVGIGGGEIVLNGPAPKNCALAVEDRTWTDVKSLYRQ